LIPHRPHKKLHCEKLFVAMKHIYWAVATKGHRDCNRSTLSFDTTQTTLKRLHSTILLLMSVTIAAGMCLQSCCLATIREIHMQLIEMGCHNDVHVRCLGSECIAQSILNFYIKWRGVGNLSRWSFYHQEEIPVPTDMMVCKPIKRFGCAYDRKDTCSTRSHPAYTLVTLLTHLPWFYQDTYRKTCIWFCHLIQKLSVVPMHVALTVWLCLPVWSYIDIIISPHKPLKSVPVVFPHVLEHEEGFLLWGVRIIHTP
jgi:hypothetical protein